MVAQKDAPASAPLAKLASKTSRTAVNPSRVKPFGVCIVVAFTPVEGLLPQAGQPVKRSYGAAGPDFLIDPAFWGVN